MPSPPCHEDEAESVLSKEVTAIPVLIDITAPQTPNAVINHGAFIPIRRKSSSPSRPTTWIRESRPTLSLESNDAVAGTPGRVEVSPRIEVRARPCRLFSLWEMTKKTIYV